MRYTDEYRQVGRIKAEIDALRRQITKPWTLMEICGGQTHAIVRFGIDELLPSQVTLVHGPGCPVCVTPAEAIDRAIALARRPDCILCSFGDMVRVPGSGGDLLAVKAEGGDVRIVYSPMDALALARTMPDKNIIFFAVGFETTAPATAMAVFQAREERIHNFSLLVAHVLVPPALCAILASPERVIHGFLAAGHVCTVMGYEGYEAIAQHYRVPIVVTGFEPLDIVYGVHHCVVMLEKGTVGVRNAYARVVKREGNPGAQKLMRTVFEVVPRRWRGIGIIPASGLALNVSFADFDAEKRFPITARTTEEPRVCEAGQVLRGLKKPAACAAFGNACTPEHPLGAPMVSSEGACAAYYRYRKTVSPGVT